MSNYSLHGSHIISRRRRWHPTPILLPGKSHGRRSLVGCSPWGRKELDMTERLHFHFSLSCIGEGNGNPLQCSCLENPRDGGAWWAAVYVITQSRTKLKRLSSSSIDSTLLYRPHRGDRPMPSFVCATALQLPASCSQPRSQKVKFIVLVCPSLVMYVG